MFCRKSPNSTGVSTTHEAPFLKILALSLFGLNYIQRTFHRGYFSFTLKNTIIQQRQEIQSTGHHERKSQTILPITSLVVIL